MYVNPFTDLEHEMAKSDLSDEEREIVRLRTAHETAEEKYIAARSTFREKVADYLDGGGSPTRLGRILGVTRGRIYQYRNAALTEREERDAG